MIALKKIINKVGRFRKEAIEMREKYDKDCLYTLLLSNCLSFFITLYVLPFFKPQFFIAHLFTPCLIYFSIFLSISNFFIGFIDNIKNYIQHNLQRSDRISIERRVMQLDNQIEALNNRITQIRQSNTNKKLKKMRKIWSKRYEIKKERVRVASQQTLLEFESFIKTIRRTLGLEYI